MGYTPQHYKKCLIRFVEYFNPELRTLTQDLDASQLAKFLLKLTVPQNPKDELQRELRTTSRNANEPITEVVNKLHAIAQLYYKDYAAVESAVLINKFMTMGLVHFTFGQTRQALLAAIDYDNMQNKPRSWLKLLESVQYSERMYGLPTQPLTYANPDSPSLPLYNSLLTQQDTNNSNMYAHNTYTRS